MWVSEAAGAETPYEAMLQTTAPIYAVTLLIIGQMTQNMRGKPCAGYFFVTRTGQKAPVIHAGDE